MKHFAKIFTSLFAVLPAVWMTVSAEELRTSANAVTDTAAIHRYVEFLTSELCGGRASATKGSFVCAAWIANMFEKSGLEPLGNSWFHGADADGKALHNVVGVRKSWNPSSDYVLVGAHYDGFGVFGGKIYPGADSNASGVAAMLALLDLVTRYPAVNIIFAAFDGYNSSFAGSEELAKELAGKNIRMMVNLDMLGSTLSPLTDGRKDFLIALGGSSSDVGFILANHEQMQIGFNYYGSNNFTEIFYRKIGDQTPFLNRNVPCIVFTSGITTNTNRITDTADTLDYEILLKRIKFIARWLDEELRWRKRVL